MAKFVDYAALAVITFLLTLVWATVILDTWAAVFAVAAAATLIVLVTAVYIKRGRNKPCSCDRLTVECAVRPPSYLVGLIKQAASNPACEYGNNYILTPDSVIFAAVRLSALGLNDLNNLLTKADELNRKRIFVITQSVDRRAYQLLQFHEVRITAVKMRAVYRWLSKRNALPDLKRVKTKFSFSAFFETALRRSNLKNYLFSGVILISVAFLTPLKIYYLIFGSISLLFALLTLTPLGKGPFGGDKIFDGLCSESAESDKNADILFEKAEDSAAKTSRDRAVATDASDSSSSAETSQKCGKDETDCGAESSQPTQSKEKTCTTSQDGNVSAQPRKEYFSESSGKSESETEEDKNSP